eukprot:725540-Amphidinium_carterae.1
MMQRAWCALAPLLHRDEEKECGLSSPLHNGAICIECTHLYRSQPSRAHGACAQAAYVSDQGS